VVKYTRAKNKEIPCLLCIGLRCETIGDIQRPCEVVEVGHGSAGEDSAVEQVGEQILEDLLALLVRQLQQVLS